MDISAETILHYAKKIGEYCATHEKCSYCPFARSVISSYGLNEIHEQRCLFTSIQPADWLLIWRDNNE